ncbi:hypothetical protein RYH80_18160 [Halobaculum sp. MBLA0147]|uniref:hypothetical protein n=1 Tax=Halobaculum sp. MBLA0147 TaxID=3079934 RepID=UPI003523EFD6
MDIIQNLKTGDKQTVNVLAHEYSTDQVRPDDFETDLHELQHHVLQILKVTGTDIFDDNAQWYLYKHLLAALQIVDRELEGDESRSLEQHGIEKPAPGNYNPLGELNDLIAPTVERLADRYSADEVLEETPEDNPSMALQQSLGGALVNIADQTPTRELLVKRHLLAAMACTDAHYDTTTVLGASQVTKTSIFDGEEYEYETVEVTFEQDLQPDNTS